MWLNNEGFEKNVWKEDNLSWFENKIIRTLGNGVKVKFSINMWQGQKQSLKKTRQQIILFFHKIKGNENV